MEISQAYFKLAKSLQLPETEVGDLTLPETASAQPSTPRTGALAEEEGDVVGGHSILAPAPTACPHFRPRYRHRPPGEVVNHVRRSQVVLQLVVLARPEDAGLIPHCHRVGDVPRISEAFSQIRNGRNLLNFCDPFFLGGVDRDCVGGAVEGAVSLFVCDELVPLGVDPEAEKEHRRGDGHAHSILDAPPVVEVGRARRAVAVVEPLAHAGPVPNPPASDVGDYDTIPGSRCALRTF